MAISRDTDEGATPSSAAIPRYEQCSRNRIWITTLPARSNLPFPSRNGPAGASTRGLGGGTRRLRSSARPPSFPFCNAMPASLAHRFADDRPTPTRSAAAWADQPDPTNATTS